MVLLYMQNTLLAPKSARFASLTTVACTDTKLHCLHRQRIQSAVHTLQTCTILCTRSSTSIINGNIFFNTLLREEDRAVVCSLETRGGASPPLCGSTSIKMNLKTRDLNPGVHARGANIYFCLAGVDPPQPRPRKGIFSLFAACQWRWRMSGLLL